MQKEIEGVQGYWVTSDGEIISLKYGEPKVLIPDISNGYPRVSIGGEKRYIADIVAEAFLKPPDNQAYRVFYIDGNKLNCNVNNLTYLTQSDIKRYSQYTVERRIQLFGEWA